MVAAHFTGPASLERTLHVLGEEMTTRVEPIDPGAVRCRCWPRSPPDTPRRCAPVRSREQQRITVAAIAAQKEAEDARWASETRFAALFADAAIGISIGTVQGQILEVNRAMCDMFGYTPEEFITHGVTEFVHPGDADRHLGRCTPS